MLFSKEVKLLIFVGMPAHCYLDEAQVWRELYDKNEERQSYRHII